MFDYEQSLLFRGELASILFSLIFRLQKFGKNKKVNTARPTLSPENLVSHQTNIVRADIFLTYHHPSPSTEMIIQGKQHLRHLAIISFEQATKSFPQTFRLFVPTIIPG